MVIRRFDAAPKKGLQRDCKGNGDHQVRHVMLSASERGRYGKDHKDQSEDTQPSPRLAFQ